MKQILVHGLGQNASSWDKTILGLADKSNVACPNLQTIIEGKNCTYENIYKAFSLYCCKTVEPINICGLSLGAVIALNFVIDNPGKVSSLILIAPQYKMPKTLLRLQNIIFRFMPNSMFKEMGFNKKAFITLTNSMMDLDFSEKLKNISCPTLILCGEKDKANKRACEKAATYIPKADIKFIQDSGHEVNVDEPGKLSTEINAFFNKL